MRLSLLDDHMGETDPRILAPSPMFADEVRSLGDLMRRAALVFDDPRLAPANYDREPILRTLVEYAGGPGGGFLVKPEWANEIWDKARQRGGPLGRCLIRRTRSPEFKIPGYNELTRSDGNRWGGVYARWRGSGSAEVESLTPLESQPQVGLVTFKMQRLMVYTSPVSRDLVRDSELFGELLDLAVHEEYLYTLENAMLLGNGMGQPRGVVYGPGTVVVTKDGGQAAGSITVGNINNMWSSLYGSCKANAIWSANDDTMTKLDNAATAFNWPLSIYTPAGVAGNPTPMIKGRPLILAEQLPAAGTKGDLVLCDWSQYGFVYRAARSNDSGMEMAVGLPLEVVEATASEDLLFDTDSVAYKFKIRADGQSLWSSTLTNPNGATVGMAAVIEAR